MDLPVTRVQVVNIDLCDIYLPFFSFNLFNFSLLLFVFVCMFVFIE